MTDQPNVSSTGDAQGKQAKTPPQQKFLRPRVWAKPRQKSKVEEEQEVAKERKAAEEPKESPKLSKEEQWKQWVLAQEERARRNEQIIREGTEEYFRERGLPIPNFNESDLPIPEIDDTN